MIVPFPARRFRHLLQKGEVAEVVLERGLRQQPPALVLPPQTLFHGELQLPHHSGPPLLQLGGQLRVAHLQRDVVAIGVGCVVRGDVRVQADEAAVYAQEAGHAGRDGGDSCEDFMLIVFE